MRGRYHTADVFTDRPFSGNPLAVFPDGRGITDAQMLDIARELNLSETVFVLPPEDPAHTRRLRIFTPGGEVPFAGHPTVGSAHVLGSIGEIPLEGEETRIVFEEGVGPVPVLIRARNGAPVFAQLTTAKGPEVGPPPPGRTALAKMLSLQPSDILGGSNGPQAISCGLPFLFVPLRDRGAIKRARMRSDQWEATLKAYWAPEVMVFSRDPERAGSDVRARMFAPGLGVGEDPATGSAASALGAYLAAREPLADACLRWVVEQGFEMGRPSILEVEVDKRGGDVIAIRVGGSSVMMSEGTFAIS